MEENKKIINLFDNILIKTKFSNFLKNNNNYGKDFEHFYSKLKNKKLIHFNEELLAIYKNDKEENFNSNEINTKKTEFNINKFKEDLKKIPSTNKKKYFFKIHEPNERTKFNINNIKNKLNKLQYFREGLNNPKFTLVEKKVPNIIFGKRNNDNLIKSHTQKNLLKNIKINNINSNNNLSKLKISKNYLTENNSKKNLKININNFEETNLNKNHLKLNNSLKTLNNKKIFLNKIHNSNENLSTKNNSNSNKICKKSLFLMSQKNSSDSNLMKHKNYIIDYKKISKTSRNIFEINPYLDKKNFIEFGPSIGSYYPNYEYLYNNSPKYSIGNNKSNNQFEHKKFLIKKLWKSYKQLHDEFELVNLNNNNNIIQN